MICNHLRVICVDLRLVCADLGEILCRLAKTSATDALASRNESSFRSPLAAGDAKGAFSGPLDKHPSLKFISVVKELRASRLPPEGWTLLLLYRDLSDT